MQVISFFFFHFCGSIMNGLIESACNNCHHMMWRGNLHITVSMPEFSFPMWVPNPEFLTTTEWYCKLLQPFFGTLHPNIQIYPSHCENSLDSSTSISSNGPQTSASSANSMDQFEKPVLDIAVHFGIPKNLPSAEVSESIAHQNITGEL